MPNIQGQSDPRGNDCLSAGYSLMSANYLPWTLSKIFLSVRMNENGIHFPKYDLESRCFGVISSHSFDFCSVTSFKRAPKKADMIKARVNWFNVKN